MEDLKTSQGLQKHIQDKLQNKGMLFQIQRFSVHDGPGIRTTVFLKGCNLRCSWCHNPESYSNTCQIQYQPGNCTECGACGTVCKQGVYISAKKRINSQRCNVCGLCAQACMFDGVRVIGMEKTVEEVIEIAKKDKAYFQNSGGGLTLSGGEPLLQPKFVANVFRRAKEEGIHTALDTAGCVPYEAFEQVLPYTDLILIDIKVMDDEIHQTYVGGSNKQLLDNIDRLCGEQRDLYIRMPMIAGINDSVSHIKALRAFLKHREAIKKIELLPYHALGVEKGASIGVYMKTFEAPNQTAMNRLKEVLHDDVQ